MKENKIGRAYYAQLFLVSANLAFHFFKQGINIK
jgi:hypothetical protein